MKKDQQLMHYGVLGMKWGIRKDRYKSSYDRDSVIPVNKKLQTVTTGNGNLNLNNTYLYVAKTDKDKAFYRSSTFVNYTKSLTGDKKAFSHELALKKDIKIPSQKVAVDTFVEMYKKDPNGMASAIAHSASARRRIEGMSKWKLRALDKQETKLYNATFREFVTRGEEWIKTEGYGIFNFSFANPNNPARDKYFDILFNKGYGGILDTNDINGGLTDEPLVLFRPDSQVKRSKVYELTKQDLELAEARYRAF